MFSEQEAANREIEKLKEESRLESQSKWLHYYLVIYKNFQAAST